MASLLIPVNSKHRSEWQELPPILSESLIHKFTYWNQEIKTGMRYGAELYMLLQSYPISERLQACDVGCEYQLNGVDTCITASKTMYSVWLNLKSLHQLPPDSKALLHISQELKPE